MICSVWPVLGLSPVRRWQRDYIPVGSLTTEIVYWALGGTGRKMRKTPRFRISEWAAMKLRLPAPVAPPRRAPEVFWLGTRSGHEETYFEHLSRYNADQRSQRKSGRRLKQTLRSSGIPV